MSANRRTKDVRRRSGSTLIELMLAMVLGTIVMAGIGGLIVGYWRLATRSLIEQETMQEIHMLQKIFQDNGRRFPHSIDPANPKEVKFVDGGVERSISSTGSSVFNGHIKYNNGTNIVEFLEKSVGDNAAPTLTNGTLKLTVDFTESEYGDKLNTYDFYVTPRN